jgi:hypothetical protein
MALGFTSSLLHHHRLGNIKAHTVFAKLPAEFAAPEPRSTWLQLLYSLVAGVLHAREATTNYPA